MSIRIRVADFTDAELIADLSRQTFFESFAEQNSKENMDKFMNDSFAKETLIKEVGEPGNIFLLAFDDQEPVGYVRLRENNNPPGLDTLNTMEIAHAGVLAHHNNAQCLPAL